MFIATYTQHSIALNSLLGPITCPGVSLGEPSHSITGYLAILVGASSLLAFHPDSVRGAVNLSPIHLVRRVRFGLVFYKCLLKLATRGKRSRGRIMNERGG